MIMRRIAWAILAALVIASATFIVATVPQLPERVATHFGSGGQINGWMYRDQYLDFSLVLAIGVPLFAAILLNVIPQLARRRINVPNRQYWTADSRRRSTIASLGTFGCWLGCLLTLLAAGIHYAILETHLSVPPRLPLPLFTAILITFFAGILSWVIALHVRFRLPR
jgi:uncharacterized membrane protein